MRILYIVPYVPSLIRVRPYNLIRRLSARGHRVTVATIWTNEPERQEVQALADHCGAVEAVHLNRWRSLASCAGALMTREPMQTRYSWAPELMRLLNQRRDDFDVAHIEHLRGVQYGLDPDSRLLEALPVVWDSVDCISALFEHAIRHRRDRIGRWINRIELTRTRAFEATAVSRFDRVLVTSANDKTALLRLGAEAGAAPARRADGREAITVLSNGVDLEYFAPAGDGREPNTLVFSGKLSYHANETAVRYLLAEIMPRIWAARPAVRISIVGKDPSADLRRLAASRPDQVVITGTVPDVRPFLRRAAVAVAPLVYAVGCQNKVLEAMACGTPVVATPPAVAALSARPGRDLLAADGPQAFAEVVLGLLDHPEQQREIGRAGRAYTEAHHQWDQIAARLEGVYHEAIAARSGGQLTRVAG